MRFILKWLACFLALIVTARLFPAHVAAADGLGTLALAALILCLVNLLVKPLMQLICLPVTLLTLGLFFFIVDAWMVGLADLILPPFQITGFWVRLFAALLVSAGNSLLSSGRRMRT